MRAPKQAGAGKYATFQLKCSMRNEPMTFQLAFTGFIIFVALFSNQEARAGEVELQSVLTQRQACLSDSGSISTDIACEGWAKETLEKELATDFASVLKLLNPQQTALLQNSQSAWLDYRTKQSKFSANLESPDMENSTLVNEYAALVSANQMTIDRIKMLLKIKRNS